MSGLQQLLAGRRRESGVWKYFNYVSENDKSRCTFFVANRQCGILIAGENPTNLKSHLLRFHTEAASDAKKIDGDRAQLKLSALTSSGSKLKSPSSQSQLVNQTITDCFNRKIITWQRDSTEFKKRLEALEKMFIAHSYPLAMLDHPEFRSFINISDPKFSVPGK